jgi:ABC-2 type transport system permease protein
MLRVLLAKDLRRAWRNPLPLVINLALPLCITALIGLVFGGKPEANALGRVRLAIVDEDDSLLTGMLRSAVTQREAVKHLDPMFVDRETAVRQITANEIAGAFIVPTNFTRDYLKASEPVTLELIKNPAQSVHPAVLEELFGALVTGLNAVARNFPWQGAQENLDHHEVANLVKHFGDQVEAVRKYVLPPLVTYEKEEPGKEVESDPRQPQAAASGSNVLAAPRNASVDKPSAAAYEKAGDQTKTNKSKIGATREQIAAAEKSKSAPLAGIFSYILVGMSAVFLLFIASNAMTDLQRELRFRTFERYQTMREQLLPFVLGKGVFALVLLLICSTLLLAGGGLAFGIEWQQPLALAALTLAYACFAAGLMAALVALTPGERRASTLNDIVGMMLGLAGGCMFPTQQLPGFLREHITPLLPTYWFVDTARNLQFGRDHMPWTLALLKLTVLGMVLMILAAMLFRRRFKTGSRA